MATATRSFTPREVPPSGSEHLRFPLGVHPNGSVAQPGDALAGIVKNLLSERVTNAAQIVPEPVEIELKKVVRGEDGSYRLVSRPSIRGVPTRHNTRPGRFSKLDAQGADILASAFAGESAYEHAPDHAIWEALLQACIQTDAKGHALRTLCDATAALLCLRLGLVVDPFKLAWE